MTLRTIALAALALTTCGITQALDVSGTVTLTNDYLYDGLTQTGNDAAFQAGLNAVHDSGFYLSTWASQVDFGAICGDTFDKTCKSSTETDWLLGYGGGDENFSYDIGYAYYKYFSEGDGFDYSELYGSVTFSDTKIAAYHSSDFGGTDVYSNRIKLIHTVAVNDYWSVPLEIGHDRFEEKFDFGGAISDAFTYYKLGVGYTHENWYAEAAYIKTTLDALPGADKDALSIDGNFLLSVTYAFSTAE